MARTNAIDRFIGEAEASGLDVEVQRYPDGTRTAADAAAAVGCEIDQIVKSLVFMADIRLLHVLDLKSFVPIAPLMHCCLVFTKILYFKL